MYDIFNISDGESFPSDKPNIVDPDLEKPGITDKPCKNPEIIEISFKLNSIFLFDL